MTTDAVKTDSAASVAARSVTPILPERSSALEQASQTLKDLSARIDGPEHRIDQTAREIFVRLIAQDWYEVSAAACAYDAAEVLEARRAERAASAAKKGGAS